MLEAVSEPCVRPSLFSVHKTERVLQPVPAIRERFSDYSHLKTAKKCTKDPTLLCSIAGSGPKMHFCHLKWPTADSGLECRKDSKEVMVKRVLAVMDSSFVFTCPLLPSN